MVAAIVARAVAEEQRLCAREEEKGSESGRGESSTSVATFNDLLLPAHHETTTPSSTPTPQPAAAAAAAALPSTSAPKPPKKLKAKKQEALAAAASQAEFDRLIRRAPQLRSKDDLCEFYQDELSSHCGVWDDEGLAEAHAELDGEEEFEVEQRFLSRFGMSESVLRLGGLRPPAVGRVLVRGWLPVLRR